MLQRPIALALELDHTLAQISAARNRGGLSQVQRQLVLSVDARMSKIGNPALSLAVRVTRIPFQRLHIAIRRSQAEFERAHPGEGTEVFELGIHLAQQKAAVVTALQERIGHLQSGVVNCEVQWHSKIVPKQLAVAHVETINGERKPLLD